MSLDGHLGLPPELGGGVIPVSGSGDADAYGLALTGRLPIIERMGVFAKVGYYHWEVSGNGMMAGGPASGAVDGNDYMFGVGVDYEFEDNFLIRVEWERFEGLGDRDVDIAAVPLGAPVRPSPDAQMDLLTFGIVYTF